MYRSSGLWFKTRYWIPGYQGFWRKFIQRKYSSCLSSLQLSENLQQCFTVIIKDTRFDQNQFIPVSQESYQYNIEFGKICLFIIDKKNVFVIVQMMKSRFIPSLRAYEVGCQQVYKCLPLEIIGNIKPMFQYHVANVICLKPEHGFVTRPLWLHTNTRKSNMWVACFCSLVNFLNYKYSFIKNIKKTRKSYKNVINNGTYHYKNQNGILLLYACFMKHKIIGKNCICNN